MQHRQVALAQYGEAAGGNGGCRPGAAAGQPAGGQNGAAKQPDLEQGAAVHGEIVHRGVAFQRMNRA